MAYFSKHDIEVIESLIYDPLLEPGFDFIKNCLAWNDERSDQISGEGHRVLCDLWIARFFIYHSELDEKDWWIPNKEYYKNIWRSISESGLKWPGFRNERLHLSKKDKEYLKKEVEAMESAESL